MSTGIQTPFRGTAKNSEGGNFEQPPTGQQVAVVIGLVDLGTHLHDNKKGKTWTARSIQFVWELTDEKDSKGENFIVGQGYTWSLHKNSDLRPMLEGWTGKKFSDGEEYDFGHLLGTSCMLTLTRGKSGNGKEFTEVASVSMPYKNMQIPPATRQPFAFSLDEQVSSATPPEIPDWVPPNYGRKVIDEIKASNEWQDLPSF